MNMRKTLAILSLLAALPAGAVLAQTAAPADAGGKTPLPSWQALDKNGDGVIDRSEAAASPRLAARFDQLDANHDGKLEKDELPGPHMFRHGKGGPMDGPDGRHGGMMARLDTDKDGRISRAEAQADPKFAARFDTLDVNKDGYVDKADFQARFQQMRDAWFAKADSNHDGMLSKAEFDAAKGPMMRPDGSRDMPHRHGKPPMPPQAPDSADKSAAKP